VIRDGPPEFWPGKNRRMIRYLEYQQKRLNKLVNKPWPPRGGRSPPRGHGAASPPRSPAAGAAHRRPVEKKILDVVRAFDQKFVMSCPRGVIPEGASPPGLEC